MKDAEIIINGKCKGEYDLPRKFAPAVHEVPDTTPADAGKVLTVSNNGCPVWGEGGIGSNTIIKGEQTTIAGGYVREKSEQGVLVNCIVKPSDFIDVAARTRASGPAHQYQASIVLRRPITFDLEILGQINGVSVLGQINSNTWTFDLVNANTNDCEYTIDTSNNTISLVDSGSKPTNNLEIELYYYANAGVIKFNRVFIPNIEELIGVETSDRDKFLYVNKYGHIMWQSIDNAEGGSY